MGGHMEQVTNTLEEAFFDAGRLPFDEMINERKKILKKVWQ